MIPKSLADRRDELAKRQSDFYDASFGAGVHSGFNTAVSLLLDSYEYKKFIAHLRYSGGYEINNHINEWTAYIKPGGEDDKV